MADTSTYSITDLTSTSFVAEMTPAQRSSALNFAQNNLTRVQGNYNLSKSRADAAIAAYDAYNAQVGGRAGVVALREQAQNPTLTQAQKDALIAQADAISNERLRLRDEIGFYTNEVNSSAEFLNRTRLAVSNLQAAGATDTAQEIPSKDSAGAPVESTTASEVPPASNPNATPSTTTDQATNFEPGSVSNVQDPAQRAQIADEAAIDQAKTTNNVQDPAQRAEARQAVENYQAPAVDETSAETARLARQNVEHSAPPAVDEPTTGGGQSSAAFAANDPRRTDNPSSNGLSTAVTKTRTEATAQDQANFQQKEDWRVRLSLAPQSNYLYNVPGSQGILAPLAATGGIIFPYTPAISIGYNATYDSADITHSNYKMYQYKNSSVDSITISCDFTAQDTFEANYLLAVIHFLRTVTKMFYGQDQDPKPGTPPPLCYLSGLGAFQFDNHPLAIQTFTYSLPTDVDYIRAGTTTTTAGVNKGASQSKVNTNVQSNGRTAGSIGPGGTVPPPKFTNVPGGTIEPTYVPTKMQISISAIPIITRNDISNNFSVKDYATGALLRGMKGNKRISGGIW